MPRLLAIDLGSHAVKATVWSAQGRRMQFEGRVSKAVPQDLAAPPSLSDRLAALEMLVDDNPDWGKGGNTVAVTFPGERATLHRVVTPFTDRAKVEATLKNVVETEVPFDLDDMVLAWRPLSVTTESELLVALVKYAELEEMVERMAEIGVDPKHVYVDADVLSHWAPKDRVVAVVDVGHVHTSVALVRGSMVHASRAVNVGGRDFTKAISLALQVPWDEAERLKHGTVPDGDLEGVLPGTGDGWATLPVAAKDALDGPIGLLLAEVRSSLISMEDALKVEVEEVRLCGGGARLQPIAKWLQDDLGVPVLPIESMDPIPTGFANTDGLAAAMNGDTLENEIDLRVGDLAYRGGTDLLRAIMVYGGAAAAFFCLAILVIGGIQYYRLRSELAATNQAVVDTVQQAVPDVDPSVLSSNTQAKSVMREKLTAAQTRAAALAAGQAPPTVDLLAQLGKAIYPDPTTRTATIDVSDLTISNDAVTFNAETDGYASSSAVEEALQAVPQFKNATKGNEKKVKDKVDFTMTIPLGANVDKGGAAAGGAAGKEG